MTSKNYFISIEEKLKPHYSSRNSEILTQKLFIKGELLLYLFSKFSTNQDVNGAYLILSRLNLIGKNQEHLDDYILFTSRILLKEFRSKKVWEDFLQKYKKISLEIRLFDFDESDKLIIKESDNIPFPERRKYYSEYLNSYPEEKIHNIKFANTQGTYSFFNGDEIEKVNILHRHVGIQISSCSTKSKKGGSIKISYDELLDAAKEMDTIISEEPEWSERNNWEESLKSLNLKKVIKGKVAKINKIEINKICNVVGMVGSGKSTFMRVISYWAAKNGYRIVLVLDTVAEVMKSVRFFNRLKIDATPLLGRYSKNDQLDKVIESGAMFLEQEYSSHLTAVCPLDGLRSQANDKTLNFGDEPCYSLLKSKDGKLLSSQFICPFYYKCPAKADERKLVSTSIVLTTPAGLIYGRAPFPMLGEKMKFIEYVMKEYDMVVFDEADRIQAIFDAEFCPASSIDELLSVNGNLVKQYMEAKGNRLDLEKEERKFRDEVMRLPQICDAVKEFIVNNKAISNWERIGNGSSFSAMVLLESDDDIPLRIKEQLLKHMEAEDVRPLSDIILRIESGIDEVEYDELINEWVKEQAEASVECIIRIKFILHLIVLEKRLRYISDYGAAADLDMSTSRRISGYLRNRFHELQDYLPASVVGNIFGFVYEKNNKILKTFRQYAFGRALMTGLPYLLLDKNKNTVGPNVLMLSGTSWAKGSSKYHIWADVNYILESDIRVRNLIEQTEVVRIPIESRVSGSGSMRSVMLNETIKKCAAYIQKELDEKPKGRILFVVNSYSEAIKAKSFIAEVFPKEKINYMIKDDEEQKENTIRRGEIWRFFKVDARMLVAPAGAIERGHNIVDEIGHSVLTSVFFLARPMEVPGDIEEAVTKLNGKVSEMVSTMLLTGNFERMKEIRKNAARLWGKILGGTSPRLDYLSDDEKRDVAASRLVIIHQIFGRLARVADFNRSAPSIYFADGAFKAKDGKGFDLLNEMMNWLNKEIDMGSEREIAETLYGPFYKACKRGLGQE